MIGHRVEHGALTKFKGMSNVRASLPSGAHALSHGRGRQEPVDMSALPQT